MGLNIATQVEFPRAIVLSGAASAFANHALDVVPSSISGTYTDTSQGNFGLVNVTSTYTATCGYCGNMLLGNMVLGTGATMHSATVAEFVVNENGAPGTVPSWVTNTVYAAGAEVVNGGNLYVTGAGGTSGPTASFTGSISGTSLSVSGVTGTIVIGQLVQGTGITFNTYINGGSGSSWTVNNSQTVSGAMTSGGPGCTPGNTCSDGGVTWKSADNQANSIYINGPGGGVNIDYNGGGTATAPIGSNFGALFEVTLTCTSPGTSHCAVGQNQANSMELDNILDTGTQTNRASNLQMVREGIVQGTQQDWGIAFSGQQTGTSGQSWLNVVNIGTNATDINGIAIGVSEAGSEASYSVPMAGMLDMQLVTPSAICTASTGNYRNFTQGCPPEYGGGYFYLRGPNSGLYGDGSFYSGGGRLSSTSTGALLDVLMETTTGTAPTSLSGGSNWGANGIARDGYGNVCTVTETSGVPTACTYVIHGEQLAANVPGGSVIFYPMGGSVIGATGVIIFPTPFTASETWAYPNAGAPVLQLGGEATVQIQNTLGLTQATWADNQTCKAGQISVDATYIYVCTATNTVKRATLSTF